MSLIRERKRKVKIGIMMRAMDQDSGFHLYIDGLVEAMLKLNIPNVQFVLLYRTSKYFGKFSSFKNAKEILVKAPHKFIWDQILVPFISWKNKIDILFNPKITVPLISSCPVVMGLQEPAWFVVPQYYEKFNVLYQKYMLPIYMRKASHFFSMAQWVIDENRKYIKLPFDNATVTYPGIPKEIELVTNQKILMEFREKYKLPEKFLLSMTRVDNPGMDKSKKWNPSQNPDTILKSFILIRDKVPHHLVMAGRKVREYFLDNGYSENDFYKVHFVDFVPFCEIQNIYSLADLIILPVYYESFSFTLLGAMAAGCPAVVSETGAFKEVVGKGALYADPYSPEDFAQKILIILNDENLRLELKERCLKRSAKYNWENTASGTLNGLLKVIKKSQSILVEPKALEQLNGKKI